MAMPTVIKFKRLRKNRLPTPTYQTGEAAGLDLMADVHASFTLSPMGRAMVPTGFAVEIAPGYEGQVRPRSGLAFSTGVTVLNSPGTIDADYRGEIQVILVNLGNEIAEIKPGDRIAQLVIAPVVRPDIEEAAELSDTSRGDGGFGHTGR